jgi:poly(A) polymerase
MSSNILIQILEVANHGTVNSIIPNIKELSPDTDLSLLHKILLGTHVGIALHLLKECGFFAITIPEIEDADNLKKTKKISTEKNVFKDIWPHTIRVVNQTLPVVPLRWAALFHDLGKAYTFEWKNGKVTFHHHEHHSSKIFEKFAKKYNIFSPGTKEHIKFLINNLGYTEGYDDSWSDNAVRRFDKEMGPYLDDILELSKADITTGNDSKRNKILRGIDNLKKRIIKIRQEDEKTTYLPKGLGNAISDSLNIPLGPKIGELRNVLQKKIEDGELKPNESFEYYIGYLQQNMNTVI